MRKEKSGYRKYLNIFRNMKIRNKFITACIPVIILLVMLILIGMNQILYDSHIKNAESVSKDECEIIRVRLESMKENLITCANMLTQDINRIYSEMSDENIDNISFVSLKNNIYTALDYDKRCFDDVESILFIDVKKNMCSTENKALPAAELIEAELVSQIPKKGLAKCVQFPMELRAYFDMDEPVLTIGKRIINMETGKIIGYIFLNVKESKISSIFPKEERSDRQREFLLVDKNDMVTSATQEKSVMSRIEDDLLLSYLKENEETRITHLGQEDFLMVKKEVKELEWTLISQVSIRELTKGIRTTTQIALIIGAAGVILAILLILLFSELISRPIRILTDGARRLQEGDFNVVCETDTTDEVGTLATAFQTMTGKIHGLLQQVEEEQKLKREYELALLQSQIKPHFLYNTLDLIYVFCESNMALEGARVTKALADFYRISLSGGEEIITVGEEIKNLENYLFIQRERYLDIMDFEIKCSPLIADYRMPKLTLQPLVENAIYHGLRVKGEKGFICIEGKMEEAAVVLTVKDDGVGMTKERIQDLFRESGGAAEKHFGLRSVKQRLQLYYGERCKMHINSSPGKGTSVSIEIPKKMGDSV